MGKQSNVAWAAGLFEGEGCLTIRGPWKSAALSLSSTDLDVLERFREVVGEGSIIGPDVRGSNKPIWRWHVQGAAEVLVVIRLLEPYFGERRKARAEEVKVAAWLVILRRLRRYSRETLFGVEVPGHAARLLAKALGEGVT